MLLLWCTLFALLSIYSFLDFLFFFFKQKTAYEMRISDWSSDVCSSDLLNSFFGALPIGTPAHLTTQPSWHSSSKQYVRNVLADVSLWAGMSCEHGVDRKSVV